MQSLTLTSRLRRDADYIWQKIFAHPFVVELFSGQLPLGKFKYYVVQDYGYLMGMMRALSFLAARAEFTIARIALEQAYADATIEIDNYTALLKELGLSLDEVLATEPSPTNEAYMNFLKSKCAFDSALECLVSVLPCFWTYLEIAELHKDKLKENKNKIYMNWASVYLSNEYRGIVNKLKSIADKSWKGEDYEALKKAFITASKYEYMFWNSAYREEQWII